MVIKKPNRDNTYDNVEKPKHYTLHPSGVEQIEISEHMNFCRGNAIKYIWRAGEKGDKDKEIEDLKKARWYIDREIRRLSNANRSNRSSSVDAFIIYE